MPKVYNRHHSNVPKDAVYIGRGTPWGNPFVVRSDKSNIQSDVIVVENRDEACDQYEVLVGVSETFRQEIREELRGKDLVCSCAPLRCHGDTLLRIANE